MSAPMKGLRLTLRLIMETNRLNSSEKMLMMVIAVNSSEQGLCLKMDSETIAQCASLSRSVAIRILQDLERLGYIHVIEVEKRKRKFKQYSISTKLMNEWQALKTQAEQVGATSNYSYHYGASHD